MVQIAVDCDGDLLVASDGRIGGTNPDKVREARRAAADHEPVYLARYGEPAIASMGKDDPVGVAAAMMSVFPGRSTVLEAPDVVWDWLDTQVECCYVTDNNTLVEEVVVDVSSD